MSGKIEFKNTKWLKVGDNLGEMTNNPSYLNYKISRINKSLRTQKWSVTFSNGIELPEKTTTGNLQPIWALQLEWWMHRHFIKTERLAEKGISLSQKLKCGWQNQANISRRRKEEPEDLFQQIRKALP